ncbi:dihydroorotate dehydrogenase [candidate division WOR-3 bacterium]|nr:dihydroorotate dehydrogenase [candidate division WOR-3 bacterium]
MAELSIRIGELELKNPVILASGTCGPELAKFTELKKIGAIITKSVTLDPMLGNLPPRTVEVCGGMLNSIGLENPGVHQFINQKLPEWLALGIPVIASVAGKTKDEYVEAIERFESTEVSGFEINVSCPNVKGVEFGKDPDALLELTREIKRVTKKPVIIKLSPNVSDIQAVALAAEQGGADAISLINTIYGLKIDLTDRTSILGNITGGLSGPCIKPVALYYVYKASEVCKIPIIGIGGITNTPDALEFLVIGASAVEIGTWNFVNPNVGVEIADGIENYCSQNRIKDIKELIGSRRF